jgi:hypothetical protein
MNKKTIAQGVLNDPLIQQYLKEGTLPQKDILRFIAEALTPEEFKAFVDAIPGGAKGARKIYRKLALSTHPDRNPDKPDGDDFSFITSVFTALKDLETPGDDGENKSPENIEQIKQLIQQEVDTYKTKVMSKTDAKSPAAPTPEEVQAIDSVRKKYEKLNAVLLKMIEEFNDDSVLFYDPSAIERLTSALNENLLKEENINPEELLGLPVGEALKKITALLEKSKKGFIDFVEAQKEAQAQGMKDISEARSPKSKLRNLVKTWITTTSQRRKPPLTPQQITQILSDPESKEVKQWTDRAKFDDPKGELKLEGYLRDLLVELVEGIREKNPTPKQLPALVDQAAKEIDPASTEEGSPSASSPYALVSMQSKSGQEIKASKKTQEMAIRMMDQAQRFVKTYALLAQLEVEKVKELGKDPKEVVPPEALQAAQLDIQQQLIPSPAELPQLPAIVGDETDPGDDGEVPPPDEEEQITDDTPPDKIIDQLIEDFEASDWEEWSKSYKTFEEHFLKVVFLDQQSELFKGLWDPTRALAGRLKNRLEARQKALNRRVAPNDDKGMEVGGRSERGESNKIAEAEITPAPSPEQEEYVQQVAHGAAVMQRHMDKISKALDILEQETVADKKGEDKTSGRISVGSITALKEFGDSNPKRLLYRFLRLTIKDINEIVKYLTPLEKSEDQRSEINEYEDAPEGEETSRKDKMDMVHEMYEKVTQLAGPMRQTVEKIYFSKEEKTPQQGGGDATPQQITTATQSVTEAPNAGDPGAHGDYRTDMEKGKKTLQMALSVKEQAEELYQIMEKVKEFFPTANPLKTETSLIEARKAFNAAIKNLKEIVAQINTWRGKGKINTPLVNEFKEKLIQIKKTLMKVFGVKDAGEGKISIPDTSNTGALNQPGDEAVDKGEATDKPTKDKEITGEEDDREKIEIKSLNDVYTFFRKIKPTMLPVYDKIKFEEKQSILVLSAFFWALKSELKEEKDGALGLFQKSLQVGPWGNGKEDRSKEIFISMRRVGQENIISNLIQMFKTDKMGVQRYFAKIANEIEPNYKVIGLMSVETLKALDPNKLFAEEAPEQDEEITTLVPVIAKAIEDVKMLPVPKEVPPESETEWIEDKVLQITAKDPEVQKLIKGGEVEEEGIEAEIAKQIGGPTQEPSEETASEGHAFGGSPEDEEHKSLSKSYNSIHGNKSGADFATDLNTFSNFLAPFVVPRFIKENKKLGKIAIHNNLVGLGGQDGAKIVAAYKQLSGNIKAAVDRMTSAISKNKGPSGEGTYARAMSYITKNIKKGVGQTQDSEEVISPEVKAIVKKLEPVVKQQMKKKLKINQKKKKNIPNEKVAASAANAVVDNPPPEVEEELEALTDEVQAAVEDELIKMASGEEGGEGPDISGYSSEHKAIAEMLMKMRPYWVGGIGEGTLRDDEGTIDGTIEILPSFDIEVQYSFDNLVQELLPRFDQLMFELSTRFKDNEYQLAGSAKELWSFIYNELNPLIKGSLKNIEIAEIKFGTKFDPQIHEAYGSEDAGAEYQEKIIGFKAAGIEIGGSLIRTPRVLVGL